jgi:hypothetical protein
MMTLLKRAILRSLEQRGYVLMKKVDYGRVVGAEPAPSVLAPIPISASAPAAPAPPTIAAPAGTVPPTSPALPPAPAGVSQHVSLPPSPVKEFATEAGIFAEFECACHHLQGRLSLPITQCLAVYSALQYLIRSRIPGDIVDCGEGRPEVLAIIGASLVALREIGRRLVLFDVTSDPQHRPETTVPLWGTEYDLMAGKRPPARPQERMLPDLLVASGYPPERLFVVRHPVDAMDFSRSISLLALTAESYDANRAAVRMLAPRVSTGGVIAVEGNENSPRATIPGCVQHHVDAVAEFLNLQRADMQFWQVTPEFRIGLKERPFAAEN